MLNWELFSPRNFLVISVMAIVAIFTYNQLFAKKDA